MPVGVVVLLVVGALIYFGLAHRALDRMRLSDRGALLFILLFIAGSFIDIPILRFPTELSINVGGGVLPLVLAGYVLAKADSRAERRRAVVAALLTGGVIYVIAKVLPAEPGEMLVDPVFLYGLAGGLIAYAAGRSRRGALIAGFSGVVLADIAHFFESLATGVRARTAIGGAGVFDSVVISGLLAVLVAEAVGETRERIARSGREGGGSEHE